MGLAARATTNNYVECGGLLTGLKATLEHGWSPLGVVGDNSLARLLASA
jgi:ribonuclease HI